MRYENFLKNEAYHVSVYGSGGGKLFLDDEDRLRFIFLITRFQSPIQIYNIFWYTRRFIKKGSFEPTIGRIKTILGDRNIELLAFVLLRDQAHLVVKNLEESILSVYMQRILTAYGKYFNKKYSKRGHVFSGPFKASRIKNNEKLLKLSSSLHKSPEVLELCKSVDEYLWSSYPDYVGLNRWSELLSTEPILKHFKNQAEYKKFVSSHTIEKGLVELF